MRIEIDRHCGFCSGVRRAIALAEKELAQGPRLFCLGELIHNREERERLEARGMKCITHAKLSSLPKGSRVLIRTHGEGTETFAKAEALGLKLVDATCPVVKRLQQRVREAALQMEEAGGQILIIGREEHAEVKGLKSHAGKRVVIIEKEKDLYQILPGKPAVIFAQTTLQPERFDLLVGRIRAILGKGPEVRIVENRSICRQMADREPEIRSFAREHSLILFASDPMSSNGKMLFEAARSENPRCYFISHPDDLRREWLADADSIGISGATSTPHWLLEDLAGRVREMLPRRGKE